MNICATTFYQMSAQTINAPIELTIALLTYYSFDLGGRSANDIMQRWLNDYPAQWIYIATVEALYQGRYKALSVEQILAIWRRKGEVSYHFNHEFERLICGSFTHKLQHGTYIAKGSKSPDSHSDGFVSFKIEKRNNSDRQTASKAEIDKMRLIAKHKQVNADKLVLSNANNSPIKRFSPHSPDTNGFYGKLKAIARMVIR